MTSEGRRRHEMAPEEKKTQLAPKCKSKLWIYPPALLACRRTSRTCICTHALITARRAASSSACKYYQRADVNNKLHSSVNRRLSHVFISLFHCKVGRTGADAQ